MHAGREGGDRTGEEAGRRRARTEGGEEARDREERGGRDGRQAGREESVEKCVTVVHSGCAGGSPAVARWSHGGGCFSTGGGLKVWKSV